MSPNGEEEYTSKGKYEDPWGKRQCILVNIGVTPPRRTRSVLKENKGEKKENGEKIRSEISHNLDNLEMPVLDPFGLNCPSVHLKWLKVLG